MINYYAGYLAIVSGYFKTFVFTICLIGLGFTEATIYTPTASRYGFESCADK